MIPFAWQYWGGIPINTIKHRAEHYCINIDISILSHIYNVAIKAGIVDKNPCKEVRRLGVIQTKDRVLSQSEIALLLDKLHGKDRLMVLVGLFTGLRLGGGIRLISARY